MDQNKGSNVQWIKVVSWQGEMIVQSYLRFEVSHIMKYPKNPQKSTLSPTDFNTAADKVEEDRMTVVF